MGYYPYLNRIKSNVRTVLCAAICMVLPSLSGQNVRPFDGTWKMNLELSQGQNDQTRVIQFSKLADGRLLFTLSATGPSGEPLFTQAVLRLDGAASPLHQTQDFATLLASETATAKQVSAKLENGNRIAAIHAPSGAPRTWTVSPDGATLTEETRAGKAIYQKVR